MRTGRVAEVAGLCWWRLRKWTCSGVQVQVQRVKVAVVSCLGLEIPRLKTLKQLAECSTHWLERAAHGRRGVLGPERVHVMTPVKGGMACLSMITLAGRTREGQEY